MTRSETMVQGPWTPGLIWPLVLSLVGAAVVLFQPIVGFLVFLVGAVWLVSRSLTVSLALYAFLAPFPLGPVLHGHKIFVTDLLAIIIMVALAVGMWQRGGTRALWDGFFPRVFRWPLVLLFVLSVLSLAVAWSHSGTVVKIMEYAEFFLVIVAAVKEGAMDRRHWTLVFQGLLLGAVIVTIYGFIQFLLGLGPTTNEIALVHVRATAFFGQPNVFGAFDEQIFPFLAAAIAFGPPEWRKAWWLWAGTVLMALGVVVSYSRGAWVGDAAAVAVIGFVALARGRRQAIGWFVTSGIAVPVVMFVVATVFSHMHFGNHHPLPPVAFENRNTASRIGSLVSPTSSYDNQQRILIYKSALSAIKQHPILGVGLGNFHLFIARFRPKGLQAIPPMAHDLYLEWGADLGIAGIIAGFWIEWRWLAGTWSALTQRAKQLEPWVFAAILGSLGCIVAFIVHDWVDFMIDHGVIVPLLLALGTVVGWAPGGEAAEPSK